MSERRSRRAHDGVLDWRNIGEFIREGVMVAVPLCFPGQTVPPPAGETAITTLAVDPLRTVYCGTAGNAAHVLAAMIHQDSGIVHDLGTVPGATSVDALAVTGDGLAILATGSAGTSLWRTERFSKSFLIQEWTIRRPPIEKVADVLGPDVTPAAAACLDGRVLLGLTAPTGELFRLDLATGECTTLAAVDERGHFGRAVVLDSSGRLWGSAGNARLWVYDPEADRLEKTGIEAVAAAGRSQHSQVSAWAPAPGTGLLYGGTEPDGFVFRFDPARREMTPLGKPTRCEPVTCMTAGNDGRVFGMTGGDDDLAHMFVHDPASGALCDLGMPVAVLGERQYGYHFRCAATGRDGEIYFGQHERVNHLWVYFPAIRRAV